MRDREPVDVQSSYDSVAEEYARQISGELEHKPFDRQILDRFAEWVRPVGPACDLGCGPGHVARHLSGRGIEVVGVDLSAEMVRVARGLNPGVEFRQGDMRSLGAGGRAWGGIVAFYSLIHIPPPEVEAVLVELRRALRPGGLLLLAFHVGDDLKHLDEWWGRPVSVDFHFFRPDWMSGLLRSAGFRIAEVVEREPYPDVEHPSRRAYILAENPRAEEDAARMTS